MLLLLGVVVGCGRSSAVVVFGWLVFVVCCFSLSVAWCGLVLFVRRWVLLIVRCSLSLAVVVFAGH